MWRVCAVVLAVPVSGDMMPDVFVDWSNMLTGFVSRAISGGCVSRIVLGQAFVVS
jgi:hypothetical protein